ncbi:MAG: alpha-amylase [Sphaerochaeta sp.]
MQRNRGVLLQYFHWYSEGGGKLWKNLVKQAEDLKNAGFTAIWLPPAYKGSAGGNDTGYGVYDLYDLGEFNQKGSVATKYGTKAEYVAAIEEAHKQGMHVYADVVLNHRMGADEKEEVLATPYSRDNRSEPTGPQEQVTVYTRFTFPGRGSVYSDFQWMWHHFDAVDHAEEYPDDKQSIYVLEGKQFDEYVSSEFGNYDYLMGCDLDFGAEEVREELVRWGKWYLDTTGIDGFRIDAVKHIPSWFFPQWLDSLHSHTGRNLFSVAEFWDPALENLTYYIAQSEGSLSLFDVPLHFKFHQAGIEREKFSLSSIFLGTLVEQDPEHAVTFVSNHDSQALQALESVVEPWFKPLAYALILLRREGYPCVFIADYEGATYQDYGFDGEKHAIEMPSFKKIIDLMLLLRERHLEGEQHDYFDHPNTIGWSFSGEKALAVVLCNGQGGTKRMEMGLPVTEFLDCTGSIAEPVKTDEAGFATFPCKGESISIWVKSSAIGDLGRKVRQA